MYIYWNIFFITLYSIHINTKWVSLFLIKNTMNLFYHWSYVYKRIHKANDVR